MHRVISSGLTYTTPIPDMIHSEQTHYSVSMYIYMTNQN